MITITTKDKTLEGGKYPVIRPFRELTKDKVSFITGTRTRT